MGEQAGMARPTAVTRTSDRELEAVRLFDAPRAMVFRAWSEADIFRRWWVPEGAPITLVGCEMDVRTGGTYRLEFGAGDQTMAFYGKYLEVVPNERIVWTNDEGEDGGITTVTFEDQGGRTLLTYRETYSTPDALEEAMSGSAQGLPQQLDQLEALLAQG